jgi:integrase
VVRRALKSIYKRLLKRHLRKALSQNSQSSYFNKVRAALKEALKEEIIQRNPADTVDGIKAGEPEREFLTYDELIAMSKATCEIEIMKKAFLFSALTGLRWSDINKLTWSEIQHSKEIGNYIRFTQKKTKGSETLPFNDDALKLLGRTNWVERQSI